jgi:hypothetical protein
MLRRAGRSATAYTGGQLALPTINQIAEIMNQHRERTGIEIFGWDELLDSAGLERRGTADHGGLTPQEAVAAFAEHLGALPGGRSTLARWAKQRGLALSDGCKDAAQLRAAREALNAQRVADGLAPLHNADTGEVDWDNIPPAEVQTRRVTLPSGAWHKQLAVIGMALAMKRIGPNQTLKQRALNAEAPKDQMIPGYSTVHKTLTRHNKTLPEAQQETFDQWRREAAELARTNDADQLRELWVQTAGTAGADETLTGGAAQSQAEISVRDVASLDIEAPGTGLRV